MDSILQDLLHLYHDYRVFWMTEIQNFTACLDVLKATAQNLTVLNRMIRRDYPNYDLELSVLQTTERMMAAQIAPRVKKVSDIAQRATAIAQEIDRLFYKNKILKLPTEIFRADYPDVYPTLQTLYYCVSSSTTRVIDAVGNLNYTDVATFQPLNDAIMSAFQSIEELNGVMIRINAMMEEEEIEI